MRAQVPKSELRELHDHFFKKVKPPQDQPTFYAMGGCPGSGKSTLIEKLKCERNLPPKAYLHSPDQVMFALSGYQQQINDDSNLEYAFQQWEMPARTIAEQHLEQALKMNSDIIYDRSCALPDSADFLQSVAARGYKVVMHGISITLENALQRIAQREEQRFIHDSVVQERWNNFNEFWPQYLQICNETYLYDNNAPEKPFLLIESHKAKATDILKKQKST